MSSTQHGTALIQAAGYDRHPGPPQQSVCAPWADAGDVQLTDPTGLNQPVLFDCLAAASDVLFALSGSRWPGPCQDTVRPSTRLLARDHGRPVVAPWPLAGGYGYWSGGYSGSGYSRWGWCTCNQEEDPAGFGLASIDLGVFPLTGIVAVVQDGVVLDPHSYQIQDDRHLVRLGDLTAPPNYTNPGWPCHQRLDVPSGVGVGVKGTWEVTFTYGLPPPPAGRRAAAELGYQLYLATVAPTSGECRLPRRITQIARQGVTAVVMDPMAFLDRGRVGLIQCDMFLATYNPGGLRRRSTVASPDIKRRVRRTS